MRFDDVLYALLFSITLVCIWWCFSSPCCGRWAYHLEGLNQEGGLGPTMPRWYQIVHPTIHRIHDF